MKYGVFPKRASKKSLQRYRLKRLERLAQRRGGSLECKFPGCGSQDHVCHKKNKRVYASRVVQASHRTKNSVGKFSQEDRDDYHYAEARERRLKPPNKLEKKPTQKKPTQKKPKQKKPREKQRLPEPKPEPEDFTWSSDPSSAALLHHFSPEPPGFVRWPHLDLFSVVTPSDPLPEPEPEPFTWSLDQSSAALLHHFSSPSSSPFGPFGSQPDPSFNPFASSPPASSPLDSLGFEKPGSQSVDYFN